MTHITIERADLEAWVMAFKFAHDQIVDDEYHPIGWSVSRYAENILSMQQALAQPEQERNFCERCGKRTADLTTIHTCTPPQENA
jgi:hypothetical protein